MTVKIQCFSVRNATTNKRIHSRKEYTMITYTENKKFTQQDAEKLFLSIGWLSGKYPSQLYKALINSSTVLTAWDNGRLIGLVRVMDDTLMTAFIHYVLVHPDYQGQGIAGRMIEMIKEKYKDFLYLELMPEESRNAAFYENHGFSVMPDGVAMQIHNHGFAE